MAQYVPSNKLNLIFAACDEEDSHHPFVDGAAEAGPGGV